MMVKMLEFLKKQGYKRASLAVQKANYAVKMYKRVGFRLWMRRSRSILWCVSYREELIFWRINGLISGKTVLWPVM